MSGAKTEYPQHTILSKCADAAHSAVETALPRKGYQNVNIQLASIIRTQINVNSLTSPTLSAHSHPHMHPSSSHLPTTPSTSPQPSPAPSPTHSHSAWISSFSAPRVMLLQPSTAACAPWPFPRGVPGTVVQESRNVGAEIMAIAITEGGGEV